MFDLKTILRRNPTQAAAGALAPASRATPAPSLPAASGSTQSSELETDPGEDACATFLWSALAIALALTFLIGCATPPPKPAAAPAVFYPAPPDAPRLQFLTSFSSEAELHGSGENKFSTFVVGKTPPPKPINKPYGLALRKNELFICDTGFGMVLIADLQKGQFRPFAPSGEAQMKMPINITLDADATRYITDTVRGQVLIYSADGRYRAAIGKKDEMKPVDVAIHEDRLYVTDLKGHCVRVYSKSSLEPLFTIPRDPKDKAAQLFSPTNLDLDHSGHLFVADTGGFRVQEYDLEGKFVRTLGTGGDSPGEFGLPKGIAVDHEDRVYVVDSKMQVIQIFDKEGKLLLFFGEPGSSTASLNLPAQVIIDYDHVHLFKKYAAPGFELEYLLFVTNQFGDRKVAVYGFGHKT